MLPQDPDDLLFREPARFHVHPLGGDGLYSDSEEFPGLRSEAMKFANLVLQSPIIRSRHDLFPAAGRGQAGLRHQPTPGEQVVWGNACRRATRLTVISGSRVSSTMRTFSGAIQRRRR